MSWLIAKHPAESGNNSSYFEPRYFKRRTVLCRRTKAIGETVRRNSTVDYSDDKGTDTLIRRLSCISAPVKNYNISIY